MNPKTIFLSALFALACLLPSKAQEKTPITELSPLPVTTEDYCTFLNNSVTDNLLGLYEEKMNNIERSGNPGAYHYTVTPGNEQTSATFMNQLLAAQYEMRSDSAASIFLAQALPTDPALQSNHSILQNTPKSIIGLTEKSSSTHEVRKTVLEGTCLMELVAMAVIVALKTKCCANIGNNRVRSSTNPTSISTHPTLLSLQRPPALAEKLDLTSVSLSGTHPLNKDPSPSQHRDDSYPSRIHALRPDLHMKVKAAYDALPASLRR